MRTRGLDVVNVSTQFVLREDFNKVLRNTSLSGPKIVFEECFGRRYGLVVHD